MSRSASGEPPPVHEVHLHHGTWLNGEPQYGNGPFFAASSMPGSFTGFESTTYSPSRAMTKKMRLWP